MSGKCGDAAKWLREQVDRGVGRGGGHKRAKLAGPVARNVEDEEARRALRHGARDLGGDAGLDRGEGDEQRQAKPERDDERAGRGTRPVQIGERAAQQRTLWPWQAARGAPHQQIGRASCRERVGQYVEISVVGGSLKKKKKE